jgi:site-specific recombinase XerD
MKSSAQAGEPVRQKSLPGLSGAIRLPVAAARARKLHVGHFAFIRSVVQGLDVRHSWERYFRVEGDDSARHVKATIQWIRDEFAAAAKRQARPGTARLVLLDASRLGEPAEELPSLEVFAEQKGLADFREADQIKAYEKEYGTASRRASRRARLISRQLEALRWLEGVVAEPPRAGDSVAAWLNPTLARRLEASEIYTLAQLVERINGIGKRWTGSIEALGVAKGARIEAWLKEHEPSLRLSIGPHVALGRTRLFAHELQAVVQPATAIRPLEKFLVPAELDGSHGAYRRPQTQCLLKARTDYEAVLAWLRSKHGMTPEQKAALKARRRHRDSGYDGPLEWLQSLSNTQRAYRKEAERFLLWAIVEKGKPLSSMTQEDCVEYREFLADPQPRSRWCGARSRERWSPLWRPFEAELSSGGQRQAVTILGNLYAFLVDHNYLMGNPWSSVTVPRGPGRVNSGRSFTAGQWTFVEDMLRKAKATPANQRLRVAMHLLYATGLRLSEVVAAKIEDLQWVEYPSDVQDDEPLEGWVLTVLGKGQKEREVPVPQGVVDELRLYLFERGIGTPSTFGSGEAFLLGKVVGQGGGPNGSRAIDVLQGIAATTLYDQIKAFFTSCARELLKDGDQKGAARLAKASTHWLRHTHASHAIAGGMPIEVAQQNLGHASLATTTVYVKTEEKRRMKAVKKFWEARAGR